MAVPFKIDIPDLYDRPINLVRARSVSYRLTALADGIRMNSNRPFGAPIRPRIAVIGAGPMGSLHIRAIAESSVAELAAVIDHDPRTAQSTAADFGVPWSTDPNLAESADAAIVATPGATHAEVALPLIDAGLPLLIEKPLTLNETATNLVVASSATRGVPIMCGFVERFNPVIAASVERLDGATPLHITSVRHSPPNPRADISVVHDLLIHDLDLATRLGGGSPTERALAREFTPEGGTHPEVVDVSLRLVGGGLATLSASRAGQRKIREITITTAVEQIELDLMRRTMTVYRHVHHDQSPIGGGYRADTIVDIPFVRQEGEPLALQLRHFATLITGGIDADAERRSIVPSHLLAFEIEGEVSRVGARAS